MLEGSGWISYVVVSLDFPVGNGTMTHINFVDLMWARLPWWWSFFLSMAQRSTISSQNSALTITVYSSAHAFFHEIFNKHLI